MEGHSLSGFLQDDWKVTPRLTLNLGLRYDYQPYPNERHAGVSNFNPYATNPELGILGRMEYAGKEFGANAFENNRNDWGPRLGFAYNAGGAGKTVIRGGYAVYYPSIYWYGSFGSQAGFASTPTAYNSANANLPLFQFKNGLPTPPTEPLGSKLGPGAFLSAGVSYIEATAKTPRSQQWNLTIQRRVGREWVLETGYSANLGRNFWAGDYDLNQLDPKYLALGLSLQDQVPNPYAGKVPRKSGRCNHFARAIPPAISLLHRGFSEYSTSRLVQLSLVPV